MKEYNFTLKFELSGPEENPDRYVDALYETGCSDASVGIGQVGRIGLNFIREAKSALEAVSSAITDVKKTIPNAKLIEVIPELDRLANSEYQHSDRTYYISDERLKSFQLLSPLEKLQWIQASNTFLMGAKRQVKKDD